MSKKFYLLLLFIIAFFLIFFGGNNSSKAFSFDNTNNYYSDTFGNGILSGYSNYTFYFMGINENNVFSKNSDGLNTKYQYNKDDYRYFYMFTTSATYPPSRYRQ